MPPNFMQDFRRTLRPILFRGFVLSCFRDLSGCMIFMSHEFEPLSARTISERHGAPRWLTSEFQLTDACREASCAGVK